MADTASRDVRRTIRGNVAPSRRRHHGNCLGVVSRIPYGYDMLRNGIGVASARREAGDLARSSEHPQQTPRQPVYHKRALRV